MKRQPQRNLQKIQNFTQGKYYFIRNLSLNLYLTIDRNLSSQDPVFQKQNNFDLQQVWMVQEVANDTFQIIHPYSSMALEMLENSVKLKANKLKNSQTFFIDKYSQNLQIPSLNVFVLKEFKHSRRCVFAQSGEFKCEERALYKDECNKWIIQPIANHPLIKQTCLIQNCNSGLLVSINESKQNEGQKIVQNIMSNTFDQGWQLIKKNQFYAIKSLKSGLVLDVCQEKMKEGNSIIQWKLKDSLNQLWILEEHGKRNYLIRSAMNRDFVLGVKGKSLKDLAELVITKDESDAFWRIVGPVNL